MKTFRSYQVKAIKLVDKLQEKCTPETICENYGQNAIGKFIDKVELEADFQDLTYSEQCDVKSILYKVSSINPN